MGERYADDDDGWRRGRERRTAERAAEEAGSFVRVLRPMEIRHAVHAWVRTWSAEWTRKPLRRLHSLAATAPDDPKWEGVRLSHVADLVHALESLQPGAAWHPSNAERVEAWVRANVELGETEPGALWARAIAFYIRGREGEASDRLVATPTTETPP